MMSQKQNQYRPKKFLPKQGKTENDVKPLSIQEMVTFLGGITGLFVAILWLAGRSYVAGYFGAMNIPSFQISFSIWEYAEVSWLRLIYYLLTKLYPPFLLLATIYLVVVIFVAVLQKMLPKQKIVEAMKTVESFILMILRRGRYLLLLVIGMYLIYLLSITFIEINYAGKSDGLKTVLKDSYSVTVYSENALPLVPNWNTTNESPALYQYNDLRLLTHNNNKYYFFRDIDPITCKPKQVFIIPDTQNIHLVLSDIIPIEIDCALTPTDSSTP